jgi:hypothetical protein
MLAVPSIVYAKPNKLPNTQGIRVKPVYGVTSTQPCVLGSLFGFAYALLGTASILHHRDIRILVLVSTYTYTRTAGMRRQEYCREADICQKPDISGYSRVYARAHHPRSSTS